MTVAAEFTYKDLQENIHLVCLPANREWGALAHEEFCYIAFLNIENGATKRKIIIKDNLDVKVYLQEKLCPWIRVKKPKSIEDVNMIVHLINKIGL